MQENQYFWIEGPQRQTRKAMQQTSWHGRGRANRGAHGGLSRESWAEVTAGKPQVSRENYVGEWEDIENSHGSNSESQYDGESIASQG